jgi:2'-5' RNA ligase
MRLFFAIEFNEKLKDYLFSVQKEVKQYCTGGNYTSKDNFHLTLRFIGEQSQQQAELLKSALKTTATDIERLTEKFELRLSKIGKFDRGNKKILWIGLQSSQELQALYNKLESNLFNIGYNKEERSFNPHITIAREVRIEEFDQLVDKIKLKHTTILVNAISLMESKRIHNKLCYVPIERVEFVGRE